MHALRFAFRQLTKSPGFTAVAVLTLGVGIAATAATFSVVKGLLLDPLPYPEPKRLVQVWMKNQDALFDYIPLSTPDFIDLKDSVSSFEAFGTFTVRRFNLGGDQPEAVDGAACTPGVLRALGVQPLHGRWFTPEDLHGDETTAVILGHSLWQQRFAGDPGCVGQTIRIDGRSHTIVGIMPESFALLSAWTRTRPLALWTALALRPGSGWRDSHWLASIARVRPGVSLDDAGAEVRAAMKRIRQEAPDANPRKTCWLMPLTRELGGIPALRISMLLGAGWTLLVLAAQNVAAMVLARSLGRHAEIAIRTALGARRGHIMRMLLTETLLLSVGACTLGFVLALWCLEALAVILPVEVMPRSGFAIDGWLLGCCALLALITTHMAGMMPALLASKTDVVSGLKDAGVSATSARKAQRKLRSLVVGQTAIALLLVSIAVQLSDSYRNMLASTRTQVSENILTAALAVKGSNYNDDARTSLWERLLENTAALPGVRTVGVTSKLPFDGGVSLSVLADDEAFNPADAQPFTEVSYVSPDFFPAIDATLLQGRFLTSDDRGERWQHRAVVINRALAERFWPGQSPIGRRLRPASANTSWSAEVVGVIADVRQVAERPARPEMYFPYADAPGAEAHLVVRMNAGIPPLIEVLREELRRLDPNLALADPRTMQARFEGNSRVFTVVTTIVDGLTVAVLGLAALGLYGTLSYTFARRRRDIGVRIALGAEPRDIIMLVLRQALGWVLVGLAAGTAGAWALAQVLGRALSDAAPFNLFQVGLGMALILAIALLAAWLPARRATRVNPVEALRSE